MERRLAAVLAFDMVGYSRLMGVDEQGTLAAFRRHRSEIFNPRAAQYHGRIVKFTGDGALIEFASVVDSVCFAVEVQFALRARMPTFRRTGSSATGSASISATSSSMMATSTATA